MSRNYSKSTKIAALLVLPIWVYVGFYISQFVTILIYSLLLALKLPLGSVDSAIINTTLAAFIYILTLLIVIGLPYYLNKTRLRLQDIGFKGLPSWSDVLLAPAAFVVYFILSSILILATSKLFPWFDLNQSQDVGFSQLSAKYEYILAFITLVVVAPVAEEVLFRGYLYGKLRKYVPIWLAILVTSLLFGFIHGAWNLAIDTFALSVVLCVLRQSTGSIWASILLHMTKNGLAFYILFINPTLFSIII